jgi:transcriptional repressor NrdR
VVNSRETGNGTQIRRRRECTACGERFTTREQIDRQLVVIKNDGNTREPFDREKIKHGLIIACRKLPVSVNEMDAVSQQVERDLLAQGGNEVQSSEIGEVVLRHLRLLNEVAYVRFASVYRRFRSINEFRSELDRFSRD